MKLLRYKTSEGKTAAGLLFADKVHPLPPGLTTVDALSTLQEGSPEWQKTLQATPLDLEQIELLPPVSTLR